MASAKKCPSRYLSFDENRKVVQQGGAVAGKARKNLEKKTGKKVISRENYLAVPQKEKQVKKK